MTLPQQDGPSERDEPGRAGAGDLVDAALGIPRRLGDFEIVREVGRGGMGVVFEAVERPLGRRVALKVLPLAATLDPRHLQRFEVEAQAVARLEHAHILPVYSTGRDRGIPYFAMPLVRGRDLAEILRDLARPRPAASGLAGAPDFPADLGVEPARPDAFFRAVARLGLQAAAALEHAHAAGVLHRDIKPANLIVAEGGHLWLTDFGLARLMDEADGDGALTRSGDLVGTIRYMSPEQAAGRPAQVDGRADVYSLGVTLHEALGRRPAFPGLDGSELIRRMAVEDLPTLRDVDPAIPADLETIVLRATARLPDDRYAGAGALAEDLRRFLDDRPIRARRPTWLDRLRRWARRPERVAEAGQAVLLFGALLTALNALTLLGFRLGWVRPRHPSSFLRELAIGLVVLDLPPVWAGLRILRGRRGGLALGVAATAQLLALVASTLSGAVVFEYGGIARDLSERWTYELFLGVVASYTLARLVIGAVAAHANPRANP